MKKYIALLFILLAVMIASCSESEKFAAIPKSATVLILGDSLSYGTGAKNGEDYPNLLAQITGWNVINKGVPGDTAAGGLERLPDLLEEYQPKLLIVELGGNDFLQQLPKSQTEANLKAILGLAKGQNIPTVLVAIPEFNALKAAVGSLSDHGLYEAIAKETKTPLIKDVFSEVLTDRNLKSDQIHPNAAGYLVVSNKIHVALKELGFLN